ncbi:MAG: GNAT family N-acetyltransferase [Candidatus Aenigmatarchaeota archaeon]
MEINIREAGLNDLDRISNLGSKIREFEVSEDTRTFWPRKILKKCINDPEDICLVAERKKKIIGFLIVNYNSNFKKAIIENIFVMERYRRKGVGTELIKNLLQKLKKLKCEYIGSLVNLDNIKGIEFYGSVEFDRGRKFILFNRRISETYNRKSEEK